MAYGGSMKVEFRPEFRAFLANQSETMQDIVADFVAHVEEYGLKDLQGRNKSSALPNPQTKRQQANFAYAQKHCLYHYHIGIPCYVGEWGDCTSEYVLHYQKFDDGIVLVALTAHPPFELPTLD